MLTEWSDCLLLVMLLWKHHFASVYNCCCTSANDYHLLSVTVYSSRISLIRTAKMKSQLVYILLAVVILISLAEFGESFVGDIHAGLGKRSGKITDRKVNIFCTGSTSMFLD